MGAFTYQPENSLEVGLSGLTLDQLAAECEKMFEMDQTERLDDLFLLGALPEERGLRSSITWRMKIGL